jgi:hypothetical protein
MWPMDSLKIPPIDTLRYLLFKNLKIKNIHRRTQRERRSFALSILSSSKGFKSSANARIEDPPIDHLRYLLFKNLKN